MSKFSKLLGLIIMLLFFFTNITAALPAAANANSIIWPKPVVAPVPDSVNGISNPAVKLNGTWKFTTDIPADFWQNEVDPSGWDDVQVPGDLVVQGYSIQSNIEYPYRKSVSIPSDFSGQKILLRIEGGYDYARVWVNGNYIRDHYGAFTTWDCDITDYVTPGQSAWITIGLKALPEQTDAIEYRHTRGLIRDVSLIALPKNNLTRLHYNTDLDSNYINGTLEVTAAMEFSTESNAVVNLVLTDPQGNDVPISPSKIPLSKSCAEKTVKIHVKSPRKWDSEHPNLYTLTANAAAGCTTLETVTRKVGFREITWSGNSMYVNGKKIKLAGINWHQNNPLLGESADNSWDEESLRLIKQANINFIRTAHYPQTQHVLDLCDEIGLYVLEETSVFFIDIQDVAYGSQSNPAFTSRYMNQFSEMIEKDKSHPSIIMWSLGNESKWGTNMQKQYDYVRMEDPSRPTIFSYPNSYDTGTTPKYEVYSLHYPSTGSAFGTSAVPELYDEYSHILCGPGDRLAIDPSIRDYYGEQLGYLWEKLYAAPGALGGAIWFAQDTLFPKTDGTFGGLTDWGILDVWNRPKPEWWNVKKAYSPVKIDLKYLSNPGAGKPINIPVQNRYNHTNLNELTLTWTAGQDSGTLTGPDIAPGGNKGAITIPGRYWADGDIINLKIYKGSEYVDEYNFSIKKPVISFPDSQGPAPEVTENDSRIIVNGSNFSVVFDKATGMISDGTFDGSTILTGGPYLNLGYANKDLEEWSLTAISKTTLENEAVVSISGSYGNLPVDFTVKIDGTGLISTEYTVNGNPPAGYTEVGVGYDVTSSADRMSYKRNGTWTAYPDEYISRNEGIAYKNKTSGTDAYRIKPSWPWSQDEADFFNFGSNDQGGHGTAEFRSSKRNAYYSSLVLSGSEKRLRYEGDGTGSSRVAVKTDGTSMFFMNNLWSNGVPGTWHQISKDINIAQGYGNTIRMRLTDNDNCITTYENVSLTLNRPATASTDRPGEEASKAVDGNSSTQWASVDTTANCDQWLKVDLGSEKTFNGWKVINTGPDGNIANTMNYSLEYSSDGNNWITADSVADNTKNTTDRVLENPVMARYVRLHVTKCSADSMPWPAARIKEFEVY